MPDESMSLDRAIEILNSNEHRNTDGWISNATTLVMENKSTNWAITKTGHRLSTFEAIAIAEKYERDKPFYLRQMKFCTGCGRSKFVDADCPYCKISALHREVVQELSDLDA